jgi:hypothetical protein
MAAVWRAARWLLWVAPLAFSAFFVLSFLLVARKAVPYPYELEWMEGGLVAQVDRALHGKSMYVAPTAEFVPFIYPPLYFYVSALVARFLGAGFTALRVVSTLATLGTGAVLWLRVRRGYGASAYSAAIAVGLYFASFLVTGAWFEVGRVDNLFVLLLAAGLYLLQSSRTARGDALAAIVMFCAFFTKQTALMIAVPLSFWCVLSFTGSRRITFPAVFAILAGVSVLAFNRATGGWYGYYVFEVPAQHPLLRPLILEFWTKDILGHVPLAAVLAVVALLHRANVGRRERAFDSVVLASVVVAGWSSRIHEGGWINVLLPVYAEIAVFAAVGLNVVLSDERLAAARTAACCAVFFQLFALQYWAPHQLPQGLAEGRALIDRLRSAPGDVFMPSHGWYSALAGKPTFAQTQAIKDVLRARGSEQRAKDLTQDILSKIAREDFDYVVLTWEDDFVQGTPELTQHYSLVSNTLTTASFNPVTGGQVHPTDLYVSHRVLAASGAASARLQLPARL